MQLDLSICSHFKCLPTEDRFKHLSLYQKILLSHKISDETSDMIKLVNSYFEILQPWLDREMFFSMKEDKNKTRVNVKTNSTYTEAIDSTNEIAGDDIIIGD